MAPLEQADAQARALAQQVAAEREADRLAAEGPRPPGPDVCWLPSMDQAPSAQLSARDQRYGARDAKTGVRVSATLAPSPVIDARPLLGDDVRAGLAACFAQHVPADAAITLAMKAAVTVDAHGHAKIATLTPEPADASPLDPRLVRCMLRVLQQSAFAGLSDATAQAGVTYCLRRD
jgi:hypothetical protein